MCIYKLMMQHWERIAQVTSHMWPQSGAHLAHVSCFAKTALVKANDCPSGAVVLQNNHQPRATDLLLIKLNVCT